MSRTLCAALFLCATGFVATSRAADGPAAQPGVVAPQERRQDDAFTKAQRAARDAQRRQHQALPDAPPVGRLDELVTLVEANGRLRARIHPPAAANPQARVRVTGVDAVFEVHTHGSFVARPGGRPAAPLPKLTRYDFEPASDDALWSTRLNAGEGYLSITAQSIAGRTNFVQTVDKITVSVFRREGGGGFRSTFRATANTLAELRAAHPREFEEMVIPVLAKFSDLAFFRPGPAEVYRAFPDLPADPATTARVSALIPGLAADTFPDRDTASRKLVELGPPGVLAILRLDPARVAELTDEQRGRLNAVVAASRRLSHGFNPADAARDPRFLADCLEDADPAVRAAAERRLEAVLGHPIEFDPALEGDARAAAVAKVRAVLPKPKPPAAQPAAVAPAPH